MFHAVGSTATVSTGEGAVRMILRAGVAVTLGVGIAMGAGLCAAQIAAAPETAQWNAPAAGESPKPEGQPAGPARGGSS